MSDTIKFTIDGKECLGKKGQYILEAARDNGIYIPSLCNFEGLKPKGSCRVCTVRVNGRPMTACSTPLTEGMEIENNLPEIQDIRKSLIEILFVEGNHFCPACEKSGSCELQALAYRFQMMVPRFLYTFAQKEVDATSSPKLIKDQNRCISCKRCIRGIQTEDGKNVFALKNRGNKVEVVIDPVIGKTISDQIAKEAMEICPTGSILIREKGYDVPIGKRKYDSTPIGNEIENK